MPMDLPSDQHEEASYIIFKKDGDVFARNGSTGDIEFSGTDLATVIQSTIGTGRRIFVKTPSTPYRTEDWIDIDVNNVTLEFESTHAENGDPIVKVADGANVGGIRVGHNSHCEYVKIIGYGHHGNADNQDSAVKRLHGVTVEDAKNVVIDRYYITRTSPYHEHNTGGSGITLYNASSYCTVCNGEINDVGDRGVQMSGSYQTVKHNHIHDSYDRAISFDAQEFDGTWHASSYSKALFNEVHDESAGSLIKQSEASDECYRNIIAGNLGYGNHKQGIGGVGSEESIYGNTMIGTNTTLNGGNYGIIVRQDSVCYGNWIYDYSDEGIRQAGDRSNVFNNYISNCNTGVHILSHFDTTKGNYIANCTNGITVAENTYHHLIASNYFRLENYPIKMIGSSGNEIQLVSIRNNHIQSSGVAGATLIDMAYCLDVAVEGNSIMQGTGANSIADDADSSNVTAKDNKIADSPGISLSGTNSIKMRNEGVDNAVSSAPSSPSAGMVYLDDGTNTGDGAPHYRYYDGSAWNDL